MNLDFYVIQHDRILSHLPNKCQCFFDNIVVGDVINDEAGDGEVERRQPAATPL